MQHIPNIYWLLYWLMVAAFFFFWVIAFYDLNQVFSLTLRLEFKGRGALLHCNKVKRETLNVCCPRNGK